MPAKVISITNVQWAGAKQATRVDDSSHHSREGQADSVWAALRDGQRATTSTKTVKDEEGNDVEKLSFEKPAKRQKQGEESDDEDFASVLCRNDLIGEGVAKAFQRKRSVGGASASVRTSGSLLKTT